MCLRNSKLRDLITAFFVGILLFNYVNSSMFWHSHVIDGRIIYHSHIYGKGHLSGNSDGGHTLGQLRLLDIINHTLCTDTIIPDVSIARIDVLEYIPQESPIPECLVGSVSFLDLRGPPSLI